MSDEIIFEQRHEWNEEGSHAFLPRSKSEESAVSAEALWKSTPWVYKELQGQHGGE